MSEERPTTRQGFLSRMFSGVDVNEEEGTTVYSAEEVGVRAEETVEPRGFTVERAAAGIDIADLATSTRARESKLNSEIELSESRIRELKDQTEEVIRSYELEIRKAREARDSGISDEERKIAVARSGLEDVERVRDFFGLQDVETTTSDFGAQDLPAGEETEVMERVEEDDTEILRRPGPLAEGYLDPGENRDR
jgi:ribosome-binding protein aMBF1 (putative translation factor)